MSTEIEVTGHEGACDLGRGTLLNDVKTDPHQTWPISYTLTERADWEKNYLVLPRIAAPTSIQ